MEQRPDQPEQEEAGLKECLNDKSLSGTAIKEEVESLKTLRLNGKRTTSLYYYRELQNLTDPLHFRVGMRVFGSKPDYFNHFSLRRLV